MDIMPMIPVISALEGILVAILLVSASKLSTTLTSTDSIVTMKKFSPLSKQPLLRIQRKEFKPVFVKDVQNIDHTNEAKL